MALNVTTAAIASGANTAIAQPSLAQWDQGQILKIEGVELPESYQVEFSGGGTVRTVPMIGTAEGVEIPNKLLQSSHPITAHVVLHESTTDRETEYWITIYVKPRQAPETVEIDPADISIIDQTIAAAQQAVATSTAQAEAAAGSAADAAASAEAAAANETAAAGSASSAASSERSAGASAVEAGQAKTAAETAQGAAEAAQAAAEQAVTDAQAAGSQAVEAIDEAKTAGIQAIDAEAATQINQVGRAGATQIRQINELASNQMRSIETKTTQSIGAIEDARDAAIEDVQTEGQTQTAAAQAQAQAAAGSASAAANSASAAAGSASAAATARTGAETAAASVSASAAQIAQNASDITDLNRQLSDVEETVDAIAELKESVNLYNKNSALNRDNVRLPTSGSYSALNGSSVSHPIPIELGKTYSFKFSAGYYGVTANRIVRFCDSEGNLITSVPAGMSSYINATVSSDNSYGTFTVTNDINYPYCCVNVRMSDKGVMVFAEGDTLPAYSDWSEPKWMIREAALPDNLPLPVNAQNNILYGKKAAFTGDSICYGAGASGGYARIIGVDNSMVISNSGQTGATLATGTTSDGVNRGWISQKVSDMPQDYDYYIVEGGVNDADLSLGVQLGALTNGYTATLDTTTLYGAMETICKILQTTFVGKKYGFIIPHNCYSQDSRWNTEFRPAMKECLKKWGIPFLDLSEECAQLRNIDALRVYTANNDGWHPTEDGYKIFYVPKIEAWMKTL